MHWLIWSPAHANCLAVHTCWLTSCCLQPSTAYNDRVSPASLLAYSLFCILLSHQFSLSWAERERAGEEYTVGAVYLCLLYNFLTFLEWNDVMVPDGFFFKSFLFLPFVHWRKLKYHWQRNPASSWEGHLCTGLPLPCVWFACRNLWLVLSVRKNRDTNQEKCPFPSFKFPFPKTETGT